MRYFKLAETTEYEHPRWGTPYKKPVLVKHYRLVDNNKYRPHTGKKQLTKALARSRPFLVDTSGSITTEELTAFVNEVNDVIDNAA